MRKSHFPRGTKSLRQSPMVIPSTRKPSPWDSLLWSLNPLGSKGSRNIKDDPEDENTSKILLCFRAPEAQWCRGHENQTTKTNTTRKCNSQVLDTQKIQRRNIRLKLKRQQMLHTNLGKWAYPHNSKTSKKKTAEKRNVTQMDKGLGISRRNLYNGVCERCKAGTDLQIPFTFYKNILSFFIFSSQLKFSVSHTFTHTHSHTHIPTHTHIHTHILSHPLLLTHIHSHSYTPTNTHTHSHTHPFSHSHQLTLTHAHSHIHSYTHTHPLTLIHTH